jgi:hypothetical protein
VVTKEAIGNVGDAIGDMVESAAALGIDEGVGTALYNACRAEGTSEGACRREVYHKLIDMCIDSGVDKDKCFDEIEYKD